MSDQKNIFDGIISGVVYDWVARFSGYGPEFYRRAAAAIPVRPGMDLLDLGCGTASLSLALAERMKGKGHIIGIDRSSKQLARARERLRFASVSIELRLGEVQQLPFDEASIDGICMSEVLHALPSDIRDQTLTASCRVLRKGGFFALVDWSHPRVGFTAAVWTPSLLGARHTHNWKGTYPKLLETFGFELVTDVYLDSLNRCQVFGKA